MTQRNIDIMDMIVDQMAEGAKLSKALEHVYAERKVCIPYSDNMVKVPVMDLGMSRRTTNALMRNKITTLQEVVNFCKDNKITEVATLGKTCGIEVLETILDYLWEHMSMEERTDFLIDTVERNSDNIREEIA